MIRGETECAFDDFFIVPILNHGATRMPTRTYYMNQVQTCLSLARLTGDPNLKRRYEELAIEFAERVDGDIPPELAAEAMRKRILGGNENPQE